uniref:Uncharacterized protein n=1 Tax=Globodera rostochiensis TaxID=31243 RepID=A0A914IAQ2_GLORO
MIMRTEKQMPELGELFAFAVFCAGLILLPAADVEVNTLHGSKGYIIVHMHHHHQCVRLATIEALDMGDKE